MNCGKCTRSFVKDSKNAFGISMKLTPTVLRSMQTTTVGIYFYCMFFLMSPTFGPTDHGLKTYGAYFGVLFGSLVTGLLIILSMEFAMSKDMPKLLIIPIVLFMIILISLLFVYFPRVYNDSTKNGVDKSPAYVGATFATVVLTIAVVMLCRFSAQKSFVINPQSAHSDDLSMAEMENFIKSRETMV